MREDPQWHYFYEDHYSLIRCSYKYCYRVKKYLDDNNIRYEWPIKTWNENTYMTCEYKHIYTELFHLFSTLVMEMYEKDDGIYLYHASDRIIHPFLNHALYLAVISGQTEWYEERGFDVQEWESIKMMDLARGRAHHIGVIVGEKNVIKRITEREMEKEKEGLANSE